MKAIVYKQYLYQCPRCDKKQSLNNSCPHPIPCKEELCAVNAIIKIEVVSGDSIKIFSWPDDIKAGTC